MLFEDAAVLSQDQSGAGEANIVYPQLYGAVVDGVVEEP